MNAGRSSRPHSPRMMSASISFVVRSSMVSPPVSLVRLRAARSLRAPRGPAPRWVEHPSSAQRRRLRGGPYPTCAPPPLDPLRQGTRRGRRSLSKMPQRSGPHSREELRVWRENEKVTGYRRGGAPRRGGREESDCLFRFAGGAPPLEEGGGRVAGNAALAG